MKFDLSYDLAVALIDSDFSALEAIYSYLAWDRRTRVVEKFGHPEELIAQLDDDTIVDHLNVILLEADWTLDLWELRSVVESLRNRADKILCMSSRAEYYRILAARDGGADGYLVKSDVEFSFASAVIYAWSRPFVVSKTVAAMPGYDIKTFHPEACVLPSVRRYPDLPDHIARTLRLYVIAGMSARLTSDEMGVVKNTIHNYVRDGYRVLEQYDETEYPDDMDYREKAFMRLTALDENTGEEQQG